MKRAWLGAVLLVVACGDTGQPLVRHRASGVGTAASPRTIGAWTVKLDVARVGLGPFTFCASRAASSELCPQALAEVASVASIDALSPTPQSIGDVEGFVGTVRSAGYGHAITWLPTQTAPVPSSRSVSGHSAHLEGSATDGTRTFRFLADVDVQPLHRGTHAVTLTALDAQLDPSTRALDVVVDPSAWLDQIDFDELAASKVDPVIISKGSRAHDAIVVSMTAIAPVRFRWSRP